MTTITSETTKDYEKLLYIEPGAPTPPIDDRLFAAIAQKIVDHFHPIRIILFGSRARGDYREWSDVDILVEMESDEKMLPRMMKVARLFKRRWWPMDLLVYTPEELEARKHSQAHIVENALSDGKILYERPIQLTPAR